MDVTNWLSCHHRPKELRWWDCCSDTGKLPFHSAKFDWIESVDFFRKDTLKTRPIRKIQNGGFHSRTRLLRKWISKIRKLGNGLPPMRMRSKSRTCRPKMIGSSSISKHQVRIVSSFLCLIQYSAHKHQQQQFKSVAIFIWKFWLGGVGHLSAGGKLTRCFEN